MSNSNLQLNNNHIGITSAAAVRAICQPLFQHFNLQAVCFCRFYDNKQFGKVISPLSTNPDLLKATQANIGSTNSSEAIGQTSNYIIFKDTVAQISNPCLRRKYERQIQLQSEKFACGEEFNIRKCGDGYVDYFDFIATDTDDFALNRFLNNIELLEHFINFFYDKADSILKASAKQKLIYPREPLLQSANDQQIAIDKAVFFNETAINRFMFVNSLGMQQAMSRREIECAHYLLLGATAKQVASELSLSPRTIETYIESLKTKTETSSKSQLIQFLSKLQLPAHYKKCG